MTSNPNSKCTTFDHIDENGQIVERNKIKYKTDKEAIEIAKKINLRPKTIHKVVAYKCSKCGFYHIGRSHKILTIKDVEHYKKTINK